jgi:hypothetical protein
LKIGDEIICEDYDALEAKERKYYAGRDDAKITANRYIKRRERAWSFT